MNKKLFIYRMVLLCLILSLLIFIFLYSNQPGESSYEQSEGVASGVVDAVVPGFSGSDDPDDQTIMLFFHKVIRKAAHVCEFALLSFLVTLFLQTYDIKKWLLALSSIGFTILYAISDEVHQIFVPNRTCTLSDVCFDSLGAILGWAFALLTLRLFFLILKKRGKKSVSQTTEES